MSKKENLIKRIKEENNKDFDFSLKKYNPFRDDREVVIAAIEVNYENYAHISDRLKSDREITKLAVSKFGLMLKHAPYEVIDYEMCDIAINTTSLSIMYFTDEFKDNDALISKAVNTSFDSIQYASDRLQSDLNIILLAIKEYSSSLICSVDKDRNVLKHVFSKVPENIKSKIINENDMVFAVESLINKEKLKDEFLPNKQIKSKGLKI